MDVGSASGPSNHHHHTVMLSHCHRMLPCMSSGSYQTSVTIRTWGGRTAGSMYVRGRGASRKARPCAVMTLHLGDLSLLLLRMKEGVGGTQADEGTIVPRGWWWTDEGTREECDCADAHGGESSQRMEMGPCHCHRGSTTENVLGITFVVMRITIMERAEGLASLLFFPSTWQIIKKTRA